MNNKKAKLKIFHYNFFPKSSKGAMEIVLLVLLVVLVVSVALFTFGVNPPYLKANVYDARFVENVYQKQDLAEFYIRQVGEDVLDKSGESGFKENFKTEFSKYDFAANSLKELQKIISEDRFNVFVNGNVLEVVINNWEIEDSFEKIKVSYYPKISVKFDLED